MDEIVPIILIPVKVMVIDNKNSEVQQQIDEPTSTWHTGKRKGIAHLSEVYKRKSSIAFNFDKLTFNDKGAVFSNTL